MYGLGTETNANSMAQTEGVLAGVAKAIDDLDEIVRALRASIPGAKTWQRAVLGQLVRIDGQIEILRMSIMMSRNDSEVVAASTDLCHTLHILCSQVATSRADAYSKAAIQLACQLADRVRDGCTSPDVALSRVSLGP